MDVMTTLIGDHQDVHHTVVVEAILLVVLLTLKGQRGTDQGPTLLMEAQTEDMVVDLVSMPDKKKLDAISRRMELKKPLECGECTMVLSVLVVINCSVYSDFVIKDHMQYALETSNIGSCTQFRM